MTEAGFRWLHILLATLGGAALGYGLARLAGGGVLAGAVWTGLGVVLLWWAFAARRKRLPATPESEHDGSHTIE